MDRGTWWATVHGVAKESDLTKQLLTHCDPMDYNPPGSSVHGILQSRILKCVAISFFRGSSQSKDQTQVSCIAGGFFTNEQQGKELTIFQTHLDLCL